MSVSNRLDTVTANKGYAAKYEVILILFLEPSVPILLLT